MKKILSEVCDSTSKAHATKLLDLGRSTNYRASKKVRKDESQIEGKIGQIIELLPGTGYKKITRHLRNDYNMLINHKKIYRIMHERGLLRKKKRSFKIATTNSKHSLPIFENLVQDMVLTDINQLWVGDITYIHLSNNKVLYLATIIDAYSRRCIGWSLNRHMRTDLCLSALEQAMKTRKCLQYHGKLVFHSDRGSQYASHEHRNKLAHCAILGSMSGKGNCYDNAKAETFFRTLKVEDVYLKDYKSEAEAQQGIGTFIGLYNKRRLHWALDLKTPVQFEQNLLDQQSVA